MCGMWVLLIEMGMWLLVLTGGDGGDGTADGGERDGDRTTSREVARNVLYLVKNFHFNSRDVRYAPSVDRDGLWLVALTSRCR
jgi:hypothetical protein